MSLTAEFLADHPATSPVRPSGRDCVQWRERLTLLLERAGRGDHASFGEFYDLTSAVAYRAMCERFRDPAAAEAATHSLYLRAWREAPRQASSGLSPLAWLLSGHLVVSAEPIATAC